jgi:beta-mannosidase
MPSPTRGSNLQHREPLASGWEFCAVSPDNASSPAELSGAITWLKTTVPCTAASALRELGQWSFESPPRRFDAEDWWFRCEFSGTQFDQQCVLGFDGLATLAEVWLNGEHILASENMFLAHEVDITSRLKSRNSLYLRFRSLDKALTAKRPRPRWKAPMIENQQLRWFRTTVLGRTPGWSPSAAAVGPWRSIWLERRDTLSAARAQTRTSIDGENGIVDLNVQLNSSNSKSIAARLIVTRGEDTFTETVTIEPARTNAHMRLVVPQVKRWWPHTHGAPSLYAARLELATEAEPSHTIDLGHIGFRTVRVDTTNGQFRVLVNEVPIFCRGACWTPIDSISLHASATGYERAIEQVRDAGMNMIRIAGTMVYEDEALLDACDRQGVLVWQEFMFANMDFPAEDATFLSGVERELVQQLAAVRNHPCLAILCGNSEVEQQAAMFGATRDRWSPSLFHEFIPALVAREAPEIPYWPSSAHGGAFPHQPNIGTTSYYGVGAYLRPIEDARRSDVRFATECLAFANPDGERSHAAFPAEPLESYDQTSVVAHINSERHTTSAFEFVRDFYMNKLFGADPRSLWREDPSRYAYLAEITTGEVMAQTFNEWRRAESVCAGALIWFWRDLVPGNGWGVLNLHGIPKAPYYYLRRALRPLSVLLTDEGCNEPIVHVVNERPDAFTGILNVSAYRKGDAAALTAERPFALAAHSTSSISVASLFDWFVDLGYAFQFGEPAYDLLTAELKDASGETQSDAVFFPTGPARQVEPDVNLEATLEHRPSGWVLSVRANKFAQAVKIAVPGFLPEDNYFHLLPGRERQIRLIEQESRTIAKGTVTALNAQTTFEISGLHIQASNVQ